MKVIIVSKRHHGTRSLHLNRWSKALVSVCLLGVPALAGLVGYKAASVPEAADPGIATEVWEQALVEQQEAVDTASRTARQQLEALTLRLATLQARLMRLDALGERLTQVAKLENGEFDFSQPPALGGPEALPAASETYQTPDFIETIDQLAARIDDREQQLEILETPLAKQKIEEEVYLSGRPIKKGWMSSRFGRRTDPFTGKLAWHSGVDFAGKMNSDIVAVAAGLVVKSGDHSGYGNMVEIDHGNGLKTRYAHNSENKVSIGDVVKKGQVIALMGSSGRSTGPHVHFEVYKHGRAVDPAAYIHRTRR